MISTWERRTSLLNFFDWSRYKKLLLVNWPESCSALYSIGGARRTRRNLGAPSILVQTYDRQVESCLLLEGKVGSGTQCERLVLNQASHLLNLYCTPVSISIVCFLYSKRMSIAPPSSVSHPPHVAQKPF